MGNDELRSRFYESQLESVDVEIARLAAICGVHLHDAGAIEQVIRGNESICAQPNPVAFRKMRGLLEMHYELTIESIDAVGPEASRRIIGEVSEHLTQHPGLDDVPT